MLCITYKKIPTHEILNNVIGVKKQVMTVFPPSIVSSLYKKKMDNLYCAKKCPLLMYSIDVSSVQ